MHNDDDDDFDFNQELSDEENEFFEKQQEEEDRKLRSHPLYVQAMEIMHILEVLLESASDESVKEMHQGTLRESAMIILAKLSSGLRSESYLISMQKASLIRDHAEYLRLSNHLLNSMEVFDKSYVKLFREEMERFRELFIIWAKEIREMEVDEPTDEWGLFVK